MTLQSLAQVSCCEDESDDGNDGHDNHHTTHPRTSGLSNDVRTALCNAIGHLNGECVAMEICMMQIKSSIDEIQLARREEIKATIVNRRKGLNKNKICTVNCTAVQFHWSHHPHIKSHQENCTRITFRMASFFLSKVSDSFTPLKQFLQSAVAPPPSQVMLQPNLPLMT